MNPQALGRLVDHTVRGSKTSIGWNPVRRATSEGSLLLTVAGSLNAKRIHRGGGGVGRAGGDQEEVTMRVVGGVGVRNEEEAEWRQESRV